VTVVAVVSASGSGVSATSVLLAMGWGDPAVVVEMSACGGTLAGGLGLRWNPGVASLAAALRGEISWPILNDHAQEAAGGVKVVVGPSSAAEAEAAASRVAPALCERAGRHGGLVVADCGRLGPGSALWPVAESADLALLVLRQAAEFGGETAARVAHGRALALGLADGGAHVAAAVIGERPYHADEIAGALGVPVLGVLPLEPAELAGVFTAGLAGRDRGGLRPAVARLAEAARGRVDVHDDRADAGVVEATSLRGDLA
jgi:hypothetical protein